MPTYEYKCRDCAQRVEVWQSFTAQPLTECEQCGGALGKVFGNIGITFKGSGFYKTDSRASATSSKANGKDQGDSKTDSKAESKASDSTGSESKSGGKSESKPDAPKSGAPKSGASRSGPSKPAAAAKSPD